MKKLSINFNQLLFAVLALISIFFINYSIVNVVSQSLWYDEAYTLFHSQESLRHIVDNARIDQNPPLYNFVVHFILNYFGNSIEVVRYFSLLCGVVGLILLWNLANTLFGKWIASLSALFFILNNAIFYYSTEARCYTFLLVLVLLQLTLFFDLRNQDKKYQILKHVLFVLLTLSLIFTHYLSLFFLATQAVFVLVNSQDKVKLKVFLFLDYLVAALLFLPWLLTITQILSETSGGDYWLKAATIFDIPTAAGELYGQPLLGILILLVCLFVCFGNRLSNQNLFFFSLLGFLPLIIAFFISQIVPSFLARYLLYTVIGSTVVIANLLYKLQDLRYGRIISLGLIFVYILFLLIINVPQVQYKNQNVKSGVQYLRSNIKSSDLIVLSPRSMGVPFAYYFNNITFHKFADFEWLLLCENVILVDNVKELNRINLSMFSNIFHIRSWDNLAPENSLIADSLGKENVFVQSIPFADFNITMYNNQSYLVSNHTALVFDTARFFLRAKVPMFFMKKSPTDKNMDIILNSGTPNSGHFVIDFLDNSRPRSLYLLFNPTNNVSDLKVKFTNGTEEVVIDLNVMGQGSVALKIPPEVMVAKSCIFEIIKGFPDELLAIDYIEVK